MSYIQSKDLPKILFISLLVFSTYTFVFGLRKSLTVCTYTNQFWLGIPFKICLVIAQMFGYLSAKFYGIKFISELKSQYRLKTLIILVFSAWFSWLFFAITPKPFNIIFLFLNGFPLGLIWGIIFSYVEGRKSTDLISTFLAVSFIFSSGFIKTCGTFIQLHYPISEQWIPFILGLVFIIPLGLCLALFTKISPPSLDDQLHRVPRIELDKFSRKKIISSFGWILAGFVIIYLFATIFRDIRDNFALEIWQELGYQNQPTLFTKTELYISLILLGCMGATVVIKNNFSALQLGLLWLGLGFLTSLGSCLFFSFKIISPFQWIVLVGLGLYWIYIPFNCFFLDRFIASFKINGNVGFFIYIIDSIAYIGSVSVLLIKSFLPLNISWTSFFKNGVISLSIIGLLIVIYLWVYIIMKYKKLNRIQ